MFSSPTVDPRHLWMQINTCGQDASTVGFELNTKEKLIRQFLWHISDSDHGCQWSDSTFLHLRDLHGHILEKQTDVKHVSQRLSWCHSHHLARFSLHRLQVRNQMLRTFRTATVLIVMVMAMNGMLAAFGMNIRIPGGGVPGYGWWVGILNFLVGLLMLALALFGSGDWCRLIQYRCGCNVE